MELSRQAAERVVERYIEPRRVDSILGEGKDGIVFSTSSRTAVKLHYRPHTFRNELAVYRRLKDQRVARVAGFAVPRLLDWEEDELLIEMSWVRPPFILDFAGAQLDRPFDYPPEIWEHWIQQRAEESGHRWPKVLSLMLIFQRQLGIYHDDISPRNIRFENQD